MTYAPAKFEVDTSNSKGGDVFTSKYIICSWDQGHHVTYARTPFEVATSSGLGGDASTK